MARAATEKKPKGVTIIGGTGGMGKLMTHLLTAHDIAVYGVGRDFKDIDSYLKKSDTILISAPFAVFGEVVRRMQKMELKDVLLVDLSSGVSEHLKELKKVSRSVGFIHLMFGPDIYTIKNQNVVVSSDIFDDRFVRLVEALKNEGALVTATSPEHHDYMMAIVQALSQFSTIALAKTIAETETNKKELQAYASLTFSLQEDLIARIVGQSPELWSSIQFTNTFFTDLLDRHIKNIQVFTTYAHTKNYTQFAATFNKLTPFWHDEHAEEHVPLSAHSRRAIQKNAIAILGPEGSYSQQALRTYDASKKPVFFDSIPDVIDALSTGKVERAILPFENSIHGTVLETLDGLYYRHFKIHDEIIVPVEHVIAGLNAKTSTNGIRFIYSHPQALAQCASYLEKHYPHAKLILTPSTSGAFKKIKDEGQTNALAVGPKLAATIYGLAILDESIQDEKNNHTLFVVVSKKAPRKHTRFTLYVVNPKTNRPGILHDLLGVFKKRSINLLKLESRPSREKLGSYIFYVKAELGTDDACRAQIVKELKQFGTVTLLT